MRCLHFKDSNLHAELNIPDHRRPSACLATTEVGLYSSSFYMFIFPLEAGYLAYAIGKKPPITRDHPWKNKCYDDDNDYLNCLILFCFLFDGIF